MSHMFNQLHSRGYSDCFIQDGKIWGFYDQDVIPKPIPCEVLESTELESTRGQLSARLKMWCDRRGLSSLHQGFSR